MMYHDNHVLELVEKNHNMSVPHFLIHSYLYYIMDDAIISDYIYDKIGIILGENYEKIIHPHKYLIKKDFTKSGFYIKDYPSIVKYSSIDLKNLRLKRENSSATNNNFA